MPLTMGMLVADKVPYYISSSNWGSTATTSSNTLTWSHTTTADTTCLVIVSMWMDSSGHTTSNSADFNSTSLTRIRGNSVNANQTVEIFRLFNPPIGTFNARALYSGTVDRFGGAMAINLGGNITAVLSQNGGSSTTSATITASLTTSRRSIVVMGGGGHNDVSGLPSISVTAPTGSSSAVQTSSNTSNSNGKRVSAFYSPLQSAGTFNATGSFSSADNGRVFVAAAFG